MAAPHQCRRTAAAAAPQKYSRLQEQQVVERINVDQHRVALCIRVTTHTLLLLVTGHGPGVLREEQYASPALAQ